MPKLLMLKGLPASGKSTYAKSLVDKGWTRINKDDMRAMLHNSKWSKKNESLILSARDLLVRAALTGGNSVVVDDTNFHPKHRDDLQAIAKEFGADFEEKFFEITVDEAIKRDLQRPVSVGQAVIKRMYQDFLAPKPQLQDQSLPRTLIVDIDGTLAHMDGRSPYDYTKVMTDKLDRTIKDLVCRYYDDGYNVAIVSGRDGSCYPDTTNWLIENGVPFDALFMRAEGDTRNDSIVKREIYDTNIYGRYYVEFVLDDRNRVVDMWRELGLKCLQVAPGDF